MYLEDEQNSQKTSTPIVLDGEGDSEKADLFNFSSNFATSFVKSFQKDDSPTNGDILHQINSIHEKMSELDLNMCSKLRNIERNQLNFDKKLCERLNNVEINQNRISRNQIVREAAKSIYH